MSDGSVRSRNLQSFVLVLIMMLSVTSPLVSFPSPSSSVTEVDVDDPRMSSVDFSNGTGSQYLSGTQTINGITWDLRPQTTLERHSWLQLHGDSADDLSHKEDLGVTMDVFGQMHVCWRQYNETSTNYSLWSATYDDDGLVEQIRVSDSRNPGISCDMAIDLRGDQRMAWINGDDDSISIGRQVSPGNQQLNKVRTFHNRTVMDHHNADVLQIAIDEGAKEYIVWRHAESHKLWMTNYTGSYWSTWKILDRSVGEVFSVTIDESGMISVVYLDSMTEETHQLEFTGPEDVINKVLEQGQQAGSSIDLAQEPNGNEQVLYTLKDSTDTARLLRNLAGKDTGRIDTNPRWSLDTIPQGDQGLRIISDADINGDGFSDLIWSEPRALGIVNQSSVETGTVSIHLGGPEGLNSVADSRLNGSFEAELFGHGLAVCDVNGDGHDDLAVGRPGAGTSNTGGVVLYFGTASGLSSNPAWNYFGAGHQFQTGWAVECAGNVNDDNFEDILISSRGANVSTSGSGSVGAEYFGIVELFFGSANGLGSNANWSQDGMTLNSHFGTALAGQGDFNGDGYDDFAISATGTMDDYTGYSEVMVWAGAEYGPSSEPERRIISNQQGKLFGYSIAWSDVNGDGNDDLAISEPFNSSMSYQAGKVWLFHGTASSGLTANPAWVYESGQSSALSGVGLTSAGDVNEDGYEDLLVTMGGVGNKGGDVELWLGSAAGLGGSGQLIASGSQGERYGWVLATGGDVNGDGMSEIVFSHRNVENINVWTTSLTLLSEQDWESLDIQVGGVIIDADLEVGPDGDSFILITNESNNIKSTILMRQDVDSTASPRWVQTEITSLLGNGEIEAEIVVDGGGQVWVVAITETNDADGSISRLTAFKPEISWVLMSNVLAYAGDIGSFPAIAVDESDMMHIAFHDKGTSRLWYSVESSTGWVTETVRSQIEISDDIIIQVTSSSTEITYRDDSGVLYVATKSGSTWSEHTVGETTITSHKQAELANGTYHLSDWNVSGNDTFGLMPRNGSESFFIPVPITINSDTDFDFSVRTGVTSIENESYLGEVILLAWNNASGEGGMISKIGSQNWTIENEWGDDTTNSTQNSSDSGVSFSEISLDGTIYLATYNDNSRGDMHGYQVWNSTTLLHSVKSGYMPVTSADSEAIFLSGGVQSGSSAEFLVRTSDGDISLVNHARLDMTPSSLGTDSNSGPISVAQTSEGGYRIALYSNLSGELIVYRMEADQDGDNVPDIDDILPTVSGQWEDQDGDGWGDNPDGPTPDSCKINSGTSYRMEFGCADMDDDGWPNHVETPGCVSTQTGQMIPGDSFIDRVGCKDLDKDGWSDNGAGWMNGDASWANWKQTQESDGDTRGDNHGPDCCDVYYPSTGYTESSEPDLFPHNWHQWEDGDGDGYGDNDSHSSGDYCKYDYGLSQYDRFGCLDSDGDGYSDPTFNWNESKGADNWPDDGSQWWDSDGDGYGDNSSDDATNPDKFPTLEVAAIDDDNDGYPDAWTSLYTNGSSTGGLILDDCPGSGGYGESFRDRYGCPDSDGDGASNAGDPFPLESSQWQDTDEDGFGDNPNGVLGDICPTIPGFYNGTAGIGCPIINNDDDDLDGIVNDNDDCEDTPAGESVNFAGCSESQLDDDLDGIANSLDSCPGTVLGESVDEIGCSQVQSQTDSDGDGILDPADDCDNTEAGATVDENGCSENQRDSDEDGISDALDSCPNTPSGAAVDSDGCILAGVDSDNDGIDDSEDPFPGDSTQWEDGDEDGYGDNSDGLNADRCPSVTGNSSQDRLGCLDTDGDGWSDPDIAGTWGTTSGADSFVDDPTQWKDSDSDGYGDNLTGNNPDLCPDTNFIFVVNAGTIDSNGCSSDQRDADGDGISDSSDLCPNTFGLVDDSGCPLEGSSTTDSQQSGGLGGMSTQTLIIAGGISLGVILLVLVVVFFLRRDDDDWDDDEDDDDDWYDDDDDDALSGLGLGGSSKSEPTSFGSSGGPSGRPPSSSPPVRGGPTRSPPSSSPRGPSRGGPSGGPTSRAPVTRDRPKKTTRKKVVGKPDSNVGPASSGAKVRKARVVKAEKTTDERPPWMEEDASIFRESDENRKAESLRWAWEELESSASERNILMQLQEDGWSVEQSRAIIDEAKSY